MFQNLLIFVVLAINFFLGVVVVFDKHRTRENWLYGFFVLVMNFWILSNYFENESRYFNLNALELFLRIDFCLAAVVFYTWFLFCLVFSKSLLLTRKYLWFNILLFLVTLFFAAASFFHQWIVGDVSFYNEIIHFKNGLLWLSYSFWLIFLSGGGLASLYVARRRMPLESIERKRINFIFFGFLLSVLIALVINVFLQPFFDISLSWSRVGLYGMVFLVLFPAYAILRHGLLNISIIATEVFIFGTELLLLIPVFDFDKISNDSSRYILDVFIFIFASVFGYLIIKSVKKEIFMRQEIAQLAKSLEQANLRLKELDQQKTEFLSIASHQLRTPLSITKGYIELIQDGAYGKIGAKLNSILNDMDTSNERLVKLIDEFLDVTRIEQGRTKFVFEKKDIKDVVESVVKELHPKAEQKQMSIKTSLNTNKTVITFDEEKIRHVVFNFVDNAIKYSEKGVIQVVVEEENGGLSVKVQDTGIGFDKVDGANFFQKFYRGENVKGTNVTGTGLGIYVCRKFVENHNGRVWATSTGLGKGSEFGFWIPFDNKVTQ